jgi:2-polyprenyl-6-methoxyphenol hydroxylase-like FAD-dependent oxidoreductase
MFDRMGLLDELIASGTKTTAVEMHASGRLLPRIELDEVDSPFSFSITTAQTETETEGILAARLADLGVAVEHGVALTGFDQDDDGVSFRLQHAETVESGTSSWIVGADGAQRGAVADGVEAGRVVSG